MAYTQEELEAKRMHELVEIFNGLTTEHPISEFRTKAQGITRILALQDRALSQDAVIHSLPDTATTAPAKPWSPDKPTVAQRTRDLIAKGLDDAHIWRVLCREYDMVTNPNYVAWYRRGLEHGFSREAV